MSENRSAVKQLLKVDKSSEEQVSNAKENSFPVKERGIVYLSNVPHGFYETEMKKYFSQFGKVTRLRVVRSKSTGRSKGYAFIEFKEPEVAKIVAETMDNYLMSKRLMKAKYIPPEEQHKFYFTKKKLSATLYPKLLNRKKMIRMHNSQKSSSKLLASNKNLLNQIKKAKIELEKVGISYDFKPIIVESVNSDIEPVTKKLKKNSKKTKSTAILDESLLLET